MIPLDMYLRTRRRRRGRPRRARVRRHAPRARDREHLPRRPPLAELRRHQARSCCLLRLRRARVPHRLRLPADPGRARPRDASSRPRCGTRVGPHDVFPEEFEAFLLGDPVLRAAFRRHQPDLLDAAFWQECQRRVGGGRGGRLLPVPGRASLLEPLRRRPARAARSDRLNSGAGRRGHARRRERFLRIRRPPLVRRRRPPRRRRPRRASRARAAPPRASRASPRFSASSASTSLCASLDDPPHLLVDQLLRARRDLGRAGQQRPARRRTGSTASGPIASLIPQRPTIWRAISRELLDVGLGAGRRLAEDDLLGRAAAERDLDLREQLARGRS